MTEPYHKRGDQLVDWVFDETCLNAIAELLDGNKMWDIDTFDQVAELVRMTGRQVRDMPVDEED